MVLSIKGIQITSNLIYNVDMAKRSCILVIFLLYGYAIGCVFGQSPATGTGFSGIYVLDKEYDTNFRMIDGIPRLNDVNREPVPVPFLMLELGEDTTCLATFYLGKRQVKLYGLFTVTDRSFDSPVYKGTLTLTLKKRPPFIIWIEAKEEGVYSFTILEKHGYSTVDTEWKELPYLILYQGTMRKKP
jgi:hypothetical protein